MSSNGSCVCNQAYGYYYVYDQCAQCPLFTKYNPQTLSCELAISGIVNSNSSIVSSSSKNLSNLGKVNSDQSSVNTTNQTCLAKFM